MNESFDKNDQVKEPSKSDPIDFMVFETFDQRDEEKLLLKRQRHGKVKHKDKKSINDKDKANTASNTSQNQQLHPPFTDTFAMQRNENEGETNLCQFRWESKSP